MAFEVTYHNVCDAQYSQTEKRKTDRIKTEFFIFKADRFPIGALNFCDGHALSLSER
jgi:hypothetical protein